MARPKNNRSGSFTFCRPSLMWKCVAFASAVAMLWVSRQAMLQVPADSQTFQAAVNAASSENNAVTSQLQEAREQLRRSSEENSRLKRQLEASRREQIARPAAVPAGPALDENQQARGQLQEAREVIERLKKELTAAKSVLYGKGEDQSVKLRPLRPGPGAVQPSLKVAPSHSARVRPDYSGPIEDCYIFTMWDYQRKLSGSGHGPDGGAPLFAKKNLESWSLHSRQLCKGPILINNTNVKTWIPDMPDEYFRLEYDAAKSDALRYAVIYHHGGFYMDADFIVVKDLGDIIARVPVYDLISYETGSQNCKETGSFSSNFMAGRKGSPMMKAIWEEQKRVMTTHCHPSEMKLEKVCCLDDVDVKCHIPWTQLGEGISHAVVGRMYQNRSLKRSLNVFCFGGEESLAPKQTDVVLMGISRVNDGLAHWKKHGETRPLDRIAYHLFSSTLNIKSLTLEALFDTRTVIGTLYTKSFSKHAPGDPSDQLLSAEAFPIDLVGRLRQALRPTATSRECGSLLNEQEQQQQQHEQHPRLLHSWCKSVLQHAAQAKQGGILAVWCGSQKTPEWTRQVWQVSGASIKEGQCSELKALLADKTLHGGVLVTMDGSGDEWDIVSSLSDLELQKLDLLDVRFRLCAALQEDADERAATLANRIQLVERLSFFFGVTGAMFSPVQSGGDTGTLCGVRTTQTRGKGAASDLEVVTASFVNWHVLSETRKGEHELVDRIEMASRVTVSADECDGIDNSASEGDGQLHSWCRSVLLAALERTAKDSSVVGFSYGIATWDRFSRFMSDRYGVRTILYDCHVTPANSGATPSLEGYKVPNTRMDVCLAERTYETGTRTAFETLEDHLYKRKRGAFVKIDVEGDEWASLTHTPVEVLKKIDLLDMQFYLCHGDRNKQGMMLKVELLERLATIFAVTARAPTDGMRFRGNTDVDLCKDAPIFSVSYVNKARLAETHRT